MSAPSDGARADARKARAEAVVDIPSGQCNVRPDCTRGLHSWSLTCHVDSDWLAGVIADAKAEAWDEGWDARTASAHVDGPNDRRSNPYRVVTS